MAAWRIWGLGLCLLVVGPCAWAAAPEKPASRFGLLKQAVPESERYYNYKPAPFKKAEDLPKNLNWCDKDGVNYCVPSWNQHIPKYCGSCFLHATLSMISDRLKIAKGGQTPDIMLGRQTFLNCAPSLGYSKGCNGGDVIDVVKYMTHVGLPDEGCMPYRAGDYKDLGIKKHQVCPPIHACTNCMPDEKDPAKDDCWAIKKPLIYKLKSYGQVGPTKPSPENMEAMMSEIHARGPITCSISVPDDFVWTYNGGIYNDTTHDMDVDHDIEVVGWGEENGVPYWTIRNSWGSYWGELGFARIVRGVNALQIEAGDCWMAEPTWDVEQGVKDGDLIGSMTGIHKRKHIEPEGMHSITAQV